MVTFEEKLEEVRKQTIQAETRAGARTLRSCTMYVQMWSLLIASKLITEMKPLNHDTCTV